MGIQIWHLMAPTISCIFNDMVTLVTCFELLLGVKTISKNHVAYFWWFNHKTQKLSMFSFEQYYVWLPLEIVLTNMWVKQNMLKTTHVDP